MFDLNSLPMPELKCSIWYNNPVDLVPVQALGPVKPAEILRFEGHFYRTEIISSRENNRGITYYAYTMERINPNV